MCMTLDELGFESLALHSMTSQRERIAALNRFRSNTIRILVATDVASRGKSRHEIFRSNLRRVLIEFNVNR